MACEFICDGCGLRGKAEEGKDGNYYKPRSWFQRSDDDGIQIACSRECIEKVAAKTGKTPCVLPV